MLKLLIERAKIGIDAAAARRDAWVRNDLHLPLYDPVMGGCRDGLHPDRVNQNRGAESTLAFLSSLLELRLAEQVIGGMSV